MDERRDHIFLSYSQADAGAAAEIVGLLRGAGLDVWQDVRSLRAGQPLRAEITDAVRSCRKLLVLWSRQAAERDSGWLRYERDLILAGDPYNREGRVLTLLLEPVALPADLAPFLAIDYQAAGSRERLLAACAAPAAATPPRQDWGDTGLEDPPLAFAGRSEELATLARWVLEEHSRVVGIFGVAGIGKTTLLRALLGRPELRRRFTICCRNLFNPLPLAQLLAQLIRSLSSQQATPRSEDPAELGTQLLELVRERPCLLVLDNLEALLDPGGHGEHFSAGYRELERLISRFAAASHLSCLILTCREEFGALGLATREGGPVRSLSLAGVGPRAAAEIFLAQGEFRASEGDWRLLAERYGGHPFALQLATRLVASVYDRDVSEFVAHEQPLFDDLAELFAWHIDRLNAEEQEVVYWLAISRQPLPLAELRDDLLSPATREKLAEVLESLRRKIPLEMIDRRFSLQPAMVEFMTQRLVTVLSDRLIERVAAEILLARLARLHSHSLLRTQSSQHVRTTQRKLILQPILERVARQLPPGETPTQRLEQLLAVLRRDYAGRPTYAAGNLLNFLLELGVDLDGHDFSGLAVWQADLEGARLQGVDFSGCQFSHCSFTQTFGTLEAVALSPDDHRIAGGDTSGFVHVWRLPEAQPLWRTRAHENWVRRLVFTEDGDRLLSAGDDHAVVLSDARTGESLARFEGHTNWVRDLAFHPPSQLVASASDDGTVRLWSLAELSAPQVAVFDVDGAGVRSLAFSPEGQELACGGAQGSVWTIGLLSRQLGRGMPAHQGAVNAVAYLEAGLLASGGDDGRLRLWDTRRRESAGSLHEEPGEPVLALAVHRQGGRLASAAASGVVRVWNLASRQCERVLEGHRGRVPSLALSGDARLLLSGGEDQSLRLWNIADGSCLRRLVGRVEGVWGVAWSPDGRRLASGHDDGRVRIWDSSTGACLQNLEGHRRWVQAVAWSPDGRWLASASADHTVQLWEASSGRPHRSLAGHKGWVVSVDFSPDSRLLASAGRDGGVCLWEVDSGRPRGVLGASSSWIWAVRFHPDGRLLALGREDGSVELWDVAAQKLHLELREHRLGVWCLAFSRDGRYLAAAGVEGSIVVWDLHAGRPRHRLAAGGGWIGGLDFQPNGSLLASGSADGVLRLWNLEGEGTGEPSSLVGHESWLWSVAWSPRGDTLATGSQDETLRLWRPEAGSSRLLRTPRPYEGMRLRGATGLSPAERQALLRLGAADD